MPNLSSGKNKSERKNEYLIKSLSKPVVPVSTWPQQKINDDLIVS